MSRHHLIGCLLLGLFTFSVLSLLGYAPGDPPGTGVFPQPSQPSNLCAAPGAWTAAVLFNGIGYVAFPFLVTLLYLAKVAFQGKTLDQPVFRTLGLLLLLIGSTGLASLILPFGPGPAIGPGGHLGAVARHLLGLYVAPIGCGLFLCSLVAAGAILCCDALLVRILALFLAQRSHRDDAISSVAITTDVTNVHEMRSCLNEPKQRPLVLEEMDDEYVEYDEYDEEGEYEDDEEGEYEEEEEYEDDEEEVTPVRQPIPLMQQQQPAPAKPGGLLSWFGFAANAPKDQMPQSASGNGFPENSEDGFEEPDDVYHLPPIEILTPSPPFDYEAYDATVKRQARQLEKAFADFGFNIKVVDIQTGPVIAQFEIQLEKGLRLNKITGLTDDLAIALKVPSVRIVAPLPGKNTVGIELPNIDRQIVRLRDVMEQGDEAASRMAIPIYLGMDVTGKPMPVDLAKLPHLLIAGRTGTGKSVCLNSIIVSMLMTRHPDEVKMLMIDPKMVELSPYKTIPHLMHPVVTDMRKAEAILGWAVDKMEERYQLLACAGVRQLSEYNKLTEEQLYKRIKPATTDQWDAVPKKMPYLVIVADEMADLMMTSGKEVETHIIRLAQKSRAVGIHLVLATQKPTVDIITGLIKSNLPARIAFEVASRSDSQVVLDRNGAEKLLGNGDMLFLRPGTSQVVRGQGTYVGDAEIEAIIERVSTLPQEFAEELAALDAEEEEGSDDGENGETASKTGRDALYYEAVEQVIREGRGSVSLLQRKLGIGYGRASRMIDFMAEDGVVGEYNGSKSREVLLTLSQWKRRMTAELRENSPGKTPTGSKRSPEKRERRGNGKKKPAPQRSMPSPHIVVSGMKQPIRGVKKRRKLRPEYEDLGEIASPPFEDEEDSVEYLDEEAYEEYENAEEETYEDEYDEEEYEYV